MLAVCDAVLDLQAQSSVADTACLVVSVDFICTCNKVHGASWLWLQLQKAYMLLVATSTSFGCVCACVFCQPLITGCLLHYLRKRKELQERIDILIDICSQISSAMKFLEKLLFIHRDLVSETSSIIVVLVLL